jgi:nicotinate phosphoribosyltransferase
MKQRLPTHVFDLPVQELRRGYRSDTYFWRQKIALEKAGLHPSVLMQVFQKKDAVVAGIDEALAILRVAAGRYRDHAEAYNLFDEFVDLKKKARAVYLSDRAEYERVMRRKLDIHEELEQLWESGFASLDIDALFDGDEIAPWETVMHIQGDVTQFAHLETIYLGVLARRTRVATNVRRVVQVANGKTVFFFPARFDHWAVQGGDGYAAQIGGADNISTDAQGEWWGAKGAGTVPHSLIAAMGGDTVKAVDLFGKAYPGVNLVALVDFDNDCAATALQCARALGDRLWGVRLDTSESMVDQSVVPLMGTFNPTGVIPELVHAVRQALDREGFAHVKIMVSGGFNPEKIAAFEASGTPVDAYGVGSYFLDGRYDFTADVVEVEGRPCAKAGRHKLANPRMAKIEHGG